MTILPSGGDLPSAFCLLPSDLSSCALLRRALDGARDAHVGAAAADVWAHVLHDLLAARPGVFPEQRRGAHDLARLAVAALGHLLRDPRLLQRVARVAREAFYGGNAPALKVLDRIQAREVGLAVDMHGAGSALPHSTAELGTRELQLLAQDPQQRRVGKRGNGMAPAVDGQRSRDFLTHVPLLVCILLGAWARSPPRSVQEPF